MSDETALEKAFGIDLGTTYSAIAHINPNTGQPEIIPNSADGGETTPSAVYVESADNMVVGKSAKQQSLLEPDRVVEFVKRLMGKQELAREIDGAPYSPIAISAVILKQLAADAATETGAPVKKVVITCPAYFGLKERVATQTAGEAAGLEVMQIIEEPIAAALSYEVKPEENKNILVYDLGGGTFDVTLIKFVAGQPPEVVAADGADTLGGKDWDDRLLEYLVKQFKDQCPDASDITDDLNAMQELRAKAEETKIVLTKSESRKVPIRFDGNSCNVEVTRAIFDDITKDLLANTEIPLDRLLNVAVPMKLDGKQGADTFDELLLVGGSTFMPQVKRMLEAKFPGKTIRAHKPNAAVAMGAAILANNYALAEWARKVIGGETGGGGASDGATDGPPPAPTQEQKEKLKEEASRRGISVKMIEGVGQSNALTTKPVSPKSYGVMMLCDRQEVSARYNANAIANDVFDAENSDVPGRPGKVRRISNIIWKNDTIWNESTGQIHLEKTDTYGTSVDGQPSLKIEVFQSEELPIGREKEDREIGIPLNAPSVESITAPGTEVILPLPGNQPAGTPVQIIMSLSRDGILKLTCECMGQREEAEFKVTGELSEKEKQELSDQMMRITTSN